MSEANRYSKYEPLFGSWYIKEKIGQGAIGQVFEIERTDLGTTYKAALKAITIPEGPEDIKRVLSSGVAREDLADYYRNLIRNIASEFQYLAKLKGNSYIVNYEDHQIIENEDELNWDVLIKTELLTPLVEHVIEHPLTEKDVLQLGIDMCRALQFCGQYNILHRDIKPENIFIAPSGDYKLGDFGIARMVEDTYINLSRKGTYTYMAPEVFHGQKYDQSADLYSLGLVMYKYLNHGRIPFMPSYPEKIAFDDPEKAFSERMSGKTLPPPAQGSSKLRKIIQKACAYNPSDRYHSADEMLTDLEKLRLRTRKKPLDAKVTERSQNKTINNGQEEVASLGTAQTVSSDTKGTESIKGAAENAPAPRSKSIAKAVAAVLMLLLILGACAYAAIPKAVTDITGIDPAVSLYYDGELRPEYKIEPDWFKDETIHFASGDDSVFTVTEQGEIKAVSIGEADLTIKAKEYTETVHVSVVPKVTSITGLEKTYDLYTGNTAQLTPVLEPEEFSQEPVTYTSSDADVATVDENGLVTAVSTGTANITITSGGTSTETAIEVSAPVVYKPKSSGSSSKSGKSSGKKKKSKKESFGDEEYF